MHKVFICNNLTWKCNISWVILLLYFMLKKMKTMLEDIQHNFKCNQLNFAQNYFSRVIIYHSFQSYHYNTTFYSDIIRKIVVSTIVFFFMHHTNYSCITYFLCKFFFYFIIKVIVFFFTNYWNLITTKIYLCYTDIFIM